MNATLRVPAQEDRRFFGHPMGLATLFATELWERFSYYGMLAILVLYLAADPSAGGLGLSDTTAIGIFGVYSALIYLLTVPGGWIADRVIGPYRAVLAGGCVIAAGHYVLAIPSTVSVWPGMALIAIGTGLLKPNISAMVGELYDRDPDEGERRDAGFSIFYMGINIGSFFSPLICGYLGEKVGWHVGFGAAGVGMTIAVVVYIAATKSTLGTIGRAVPNPETRGQLNKLAMISAGLLAVAAVLFIIDAILGHYRAEHMIWFLAAVTVATPFAYFARIFRSADLTPRDRDRMKAYVWIFLGSAMFWLISDQGGSTLSLFAERNTERHVGGFEVPASWLQSVNPIGIVLLAPVFAVIWYKLGRRAPTLPGKFVLALLLIGLSFLAMAVLSHLAGGGTKVLLVWLMMIVLVQTIGELLLSPTGLSASTHLAPRGMESQVVALWFLSSAVGDAIGSTTAPLQDSLGQTGYFCLIGGAALALAVVIGTQVKRIHTLMGGIH
ncbi:MAG: peptide MFS transporter [Mycobacterium sp.]|nr:peptide MFS transporter [Mycobacterium sp.]